MLTQEDPPAFGEAESARSATLAARIRARAAEQGGWLPFSAFMQWALYEPQLGYYAAEHPIFGAAGDFMTAPELSPLFAGCLANGLTDLLAATEGGDIVEFGAGSGRMAEELVGELARRGAPPARYRIVEPNASLARRQRERIAKSPHTAALADRFEWLGAPPDRGWRGIAIANEVLDALPCERFRVARQGIDAIGVASKADRFEWAARPANAPLAQAVEALQARLANPMAPGYQSELRLGQGQWVASATAALEKGALLVIDYGLPRAQYYHASREGGTLCGFRRHHRMEDVLAHPGAQDLTAWVDFSALADEARGVGLEVGGFSTQAHYLLSVGIEHELARLSESATGRDRIVHRQATARFLLPGEMGERFKVMALTRDIDDPVAGFDFRDLSASL